MTASLTDYDRSRYNRQMMIPGWGDEGQAKIKASRVFLIGAGGLGGPVAIYLATAGVGEIRICDFDVIELSNLNRQILHTDERVGHPKADSAGKTLREINPSIKIVQIRERLEESNADEIIGAPDVIIDCLDNYPTRFLLNAYSIRKRIPLVHGAIWGMSGQITFLSPPETPCLRCLVPEAPPKELFPVVGVTPGIIGCLQGMEALKYLAGVGSLLKSRLLIFDGEFMKFSSFNLRRIPSCPDCGGLA